MHQHEKHPITVVSDGVVYKGVRLPQAFVWLDAASGPTVASPARRSAVVVGKTSQKSRKEPTALTDQVLRFIEGANLSREDKKHCRKRTLEMSASEVRSLVGQLKGFHSRPG